MCVTYLLNAVTSSSREHAFNMNRFSTDVFTRAFVFLFVF